MNRKPLQTLTLAAIAGLALSASAQQPAAPSPTAKASSSTTIMKSDGNESYEVRIEDGKITTFKLNGEPVEPSRYKLDQEGGFIVLMQEDAEPVIIDIPRFDMNEFFVKTPGDMATWPAPPDAPDAPGAIEWLNEADGPAAFAWSGGEPPKVMIGITHDEVSGELREKLELAEGEGVYVIEVREGLPAAKAGLQPGDILIEVDGKRLVKRDVLMEILKDRQPGDELKVIVLRDGEKQKLKLELAPFDAGRLGVTTPRAPVAMAPGRFQIRELNRPEGFDEFDDIEIFGEFDFDFDMEGLPPEAREEVRKALTKARESAREAQARAFTLRRDADGRQRLHELELNEQEHLKGRARMYLDRARENQERAAAEQDRALGLQAEEMRQIEERFSKLRELSDDDRLFRVAPDGRAFIIQRGDEARAQGKDDAEGVIRLRAERDTLEARNRELERRVEELERKLTELMARMDENQPRPRSR